MGACYSSAYADDSDIDHEEARKLMEAGKILPVEAILEKAEAEHAGRVIEIELNHKWRGYVYEIEILDGKGIVWEMKFDAQSGELIKQKKED